jgi:hypothetical protein
MKLKDFIDSDLWIELKGSYTLTRIYDFPAEFYFIKRFNIEIAIILN